MFEAEIIISKLIDKVMDERFQKLINLVREKNLKLDLALIFGKNENFRETLIKLLEEGKIEIVKKLEKIINIERKHTCLLILLEGLLSLVFQIGREVFDEARKIKLVYEIKLQQLFFSLLDENLEEVDKYIDEITKLENNLNKIIAIIIEKIEL